MHRLAHLHVCQVHFNVLRQIPGEATDFQFGHDAAYYSTTGFYACALLLVDKMDRYPHGDFLLFINAL